MKEKEKKEQHKKKWKQEKAKKQGGRGRLEKRTIPYLEESVYGVQH